MPPTRQTRHTTRTKTDPYLLHHHDSNGIHKPTSLDGNSSDDALTPQRAIEILKKHHQNIQNEITFIKSNHHPNYSRYHSQTLDESSRIDFSIMEALQQSLEPHQPRDESTISMHPLSDSSSKSYSHTPSTTSSSATSSSPNSTTSPPSTPPTTQSSTAIHKPPSTTTPAATTSIDSDSKVGESSSRSDNQYEETRSKDHDSLITQSATTMDNLSDEENEESKDEDVEYQPSRKKVKTTTEENEQKRMEDELLSKEETILKEIKEMQRKGEWLPQTQQKIGKEPKRNRSHWDYLLEEMEFIAKDFAQSRKWKVTTAKKYAKSVAKYHQQLEQQEIKKQKEIELNLRKQASKIAKLVKKDFWEKIAKLVKYKNQSIIDDTKQQLLAEKRDLLVKQTEKYTQLISQDLISVTSETTNSTLQDDTSQAEEEINNQDFTPSSEDDDSDHIIDTEDEDEDYEDEIEQLKKESEMDIDTIMKQNYNNAPVEDENMLTDKMKDSSMMVSEEPAEYSAPVESSLTNTATNNELSQPPSLEDSQSSLMNQVAEDAKQYQPTGFTLTTSKVKTPIPFLLNENLKLREYQQIGLDWLVTMHDKGLNGILADEMGLGKTIMTISLIAHLACTEKIWGPHLVVVPSSVLLNWEIEFKRWCPSLKILAYHGTQKQRKDKRVGWNKPNAFHVCITSYNLVVQDKIMFKRKKWHYLILDEAHHIRNFKGQTWQSLLNFNTERRLLLTGTPLQNNVMELWSLMHFIMPHVFQSHSEFKDWFSNSIQGMVEGKQEMNKELISRLHTILRPFILRRLKKEVSEQLPSKQEHVVRVRLSKRQRNLYEDFISRADTRETLASGNVFKMINVVMQLRKVCNHPDLFEPRPIISPFASVPLSLLSAPIQSIILDPIYYGSDDYLNCYHDLQSRYFTLSNYFNFVFTQHENRMSMENFDQVSSLRPIPADHASSNTSSNQIPTPLTTPSASNTITAPRTDSSLLKLEDLSPEDQDQLYHMYSHDLNVDQHNDNSFFKKRALEMALNRYRDRVERANYMQSVNSHRCERKPIYGYNFIKILESIALEKEMKRFHKCNEFEDVLHSMCKSLEELEQELSFELDNFVCFIPHARSEAPEIREVSTIRFKKDLIEQHVVRHVISPTLDLIRKASIRMQMHFPDKRLLQYDCGKLQKLSSMLKDLKREGHRVLIFTQMSKMLDVLESFMSMNGHSYFRLDGQTKLEERQYMMECFNNNPKIFAFILSTRSGGVGINLTGADTVIFYDSDWNPAMDAQAQDRCHRIGQTRNVNIYRLISESTIEERILLKANQKRHMNEIVIHNGAFTPDFLKNQMEVRDLFKDSEKSFSNALLDAEEQMSAYNNMINNENNKQKESETETYNEKDLDRILTSAEDENDVEALRNARKEQTEQSQNDFADVEATAEDDIINHLTPVEQFAFTQLTERTMNAVQQEIEEIKQSEKERTENWKNQLQQIDSDLDMSDENNADNESKDEVESNSSDESTQNFYEYEDQRELWNSLQICIPTSILRDLYGDIDELFLNKDALPSSPSPSQQLHAELEQTPSHCSWLNKSTSSNSSQLEHESSIHNDTHRVVSVDKKSLLHNHSNNSNSHSRDEEQSNPSSLPSSHLDDFCEIGSGSIDDMILFSGLDESHPIMNNPSSSTIDSNVGRRVSPSTGMNTIHNHTALVQTTQKVQDPPQNLNVEELDPLNETVPIVTLQRRPKKRISHDKKQVVPPATATSNDNNKPMSGTPHHDSTTTATTGTNQLLNIPIDHHQVYNHYMAILLLQQILPYPRL
ncbi:hypothetical protein C9374_006966 [Naegleria lovaniensis]|uniref:Helicase n=1 Tax=Naegleria lovaniensis TaxID=51637 RepID=A0AA88H2D6_NAELO|nr:uncharacterized protein C9374_006966 [Naegleria lovaniensis]KAG2393435.1 hypothetical protein C9374_006966 [Naegleria lovaniensis]